MKSSKRLEIDLSEIVPCIRKIHFIGIGGSGMCGIAKILVSAGYKISGSDLVSNEMIMQLITLGVKIFFDHKSKNISGANLVVISSAIPVDNPEVLAAKRARISIVHRSVILSALMRSVSCSVAVAGTHGKSTTTAMIVSIYCELGYVPTFVNGGIIKSLGTSAHFGDVRNLIVEADESDASFLNLYPTFAVITNIEPDHMDTYQGELENLKMAFLNFLHNLPCNGKAILCLDDPVVRTLLPYINRKVITYGFSKDADLYISNYSQNMNKNNFILCRKNMVTLDIVTKIPGRHNALNTAAAIALAVESGIDDNSILRAVLQFQGVNRRFDILGMYDLKYFNKQSGEVILVDDYGHHPIELYATIETIRSGWPNKRVVMVFQPHRFTRIRDLYDDFVQVLSTVDVLLILDVYSAGEMFIPGYDSISLCATIHKYGKIDPFLVSEEVLFYALSSILKDKDFLVMQGAGTIGNIAQRLFNYDRLSDMS
ncbi:UDP-N-acetylmuramate--L-alanine ligase [Blochmannia endosymbiont of Polyrhachis (Hedomyrma) turneri]|uniref:UDP-N-acetylmuramate--L-alanine ligase n=1 Tax=Blochmannia endosymbiont of Polyrhachis (Hedomyrma) turneri TaxID=1505596 RepID=UPI00061A6A7E|nr:UDP-N-acetylmuramate--L-alanine ligase [Blochmannia endosymbiont of Polyrhachis (Hedomyrma) turneri]AKC59726.1 UDP-N-acetylmuramate--L-alanine ligase [Blochmannia endosymbiont of Polyrhachis (Hedomyrma) turneri]